ncbi:GNAT family N-acetyltransferase [Georgenia subflava]|uniref:GNAT family N-acetyltransferase n=1 Tax=Georgenia subflava TaxID=1622177 RepID=UPI00186B053B|nr:GNAT family protein [Georgenia subflava]
MPPVTRLVTLEDVPLLTELLRTNREFLAPWEPERDDHYFTVDGQRALVEDALARSAQGAMLPHVILGPTGDVVGRITLNGIVRAAFQSCSVGYWVDSASNGRGLATAAVGEITRVAFDELGLHRVQAETLLHNHRSRRVLERNGFAQIGVAPDYLKIAGRWQDFALFQRVAPG